MFVATVLVFSALTTSMASSGIAHHIFDELSLLQAAAFSNVSAGPRAHEFCPQYYDFSMQENAGFPGFIDNCLEEITETPGFYAGLNDPYSNLITRCTSEIITNHFLDNTGGWFSGVGPSKTRDVGGICHAKIFAPKCTGSRLARGCREMAKQFPLYRAWTSGTEFSNPYGGYWGMDDPSSMTKEHYRATYAICEDWNPQMDSITRAFLADGACGQYVIIGNGESVSCPKPPFERFEFSTSMQIAFCTFKRHYEPGFSNPVYFDPNTDVFSWDDGAGGAGGAGVNVLVPEGYYPGDLVNFDFEGTNYEVTVPEGVYAGEEFHVDLR